MTVPSVDELRDFIDNPDGWFPELEDLPVWWDLIPPDELADELPSYRERDVLIMSYSNWAFSKPWAWEGLRRLLETLRERREAIPEPLAAWAFAVATGSRTEPGTGPGRPTEAERDFRIAVVVRRLRADGYTREEAEVLVAQAAVMHHETVRSALRRVRRDRPRLG